MTPNASSMRLGPTLAALAMLCAGCVSNPPVPPVPPQIPPLQAIARQPSRPPECTPSCSAALSQELQSWQILPTHPAPPHEACERSYESLISTQRHDAAQP